MAFKFKNGSSSEEDEETSTKAPVIEGLDDLIDTCTSCISDIEEELDDDTQAELEWDKISDQWPDPRSPAGLLGYDAWEALSEEEREKLRTEWKKEYSEWKKNPDRLRAVAAHRAKHPDWWSCFCGGY
jgi:hypothetical protein